MWVAAWLRRLRLVSGLVLLAFVAGHLVNLSLGLRSLDTIDAGETYLMQPWQTMAGEVLLGACAIVHTFAGLAAIAGRRSLALSPTDIVQLALALLVMPLLLDHVLVTRISSVYLDGFFTSYGFLLAVYWTIAPVFALQQLFVVLVIWTHAAIGLYGRLVLLPAWRRIGGLVLPILFGIPVLALLGFVAAGKEVMRKLATDPAFRQGVEADWNKLAPARPLLTKLGNEVLTLYGVLVALVVGVLLVRMLLGRRERVEVNYDGGRVVESRRGLTILETSRLNGVPHAHVCSGRGRCGTCRVEIEAGEDQLSPIGEIERRTLKAIGAGGNVRLACQARVLGRSVQVVRLLPAFADASAAREPQEWHLAPEPDAVS